MMSDEPPGGLLWARIGLTVPTFRGETEVTVALPCGHDMQVTADQYLRALGGGHVPLDLAFDGTVFYPGEDGVLRTAQIPCRHQATGELSVAVWRSLVDRYYGAVRWLRLDEDRFDRLAAYRARRAHTSFDDTVDELLHAAESLHGGAEPDDTETPARSRPIIAKALVMPPTAKSVTLPSRSAPLPKMTASRANLQRPASSVSSSPDTPAAS